MAFQSAQRNFLSRTTRGFYRHAPMLNYNELQAYRARLAPSQEQVREVKVATQVQMQDKYRKRGWKLTDNLKHPFNPGHAKVYVKDGAVAVIYPDATVSRHQKLQVTYERGWWSAAEQEKLRQKTNAKLAAGVRRLAPLQDMDAMREALMKVFSKGGK
jgi:hypothetical protein